MVLYPTVRPAPDHTKRMRPVFPLFICPVLSYWLIIFGNGTSYWMKYDHSFKITYRSVLPDVLHFPHVPMCLSCSEFLHFPGCSQQPTSGPSSTASRRSSAKSSGSQPAMAPETMAPTNVSLGQFRGPRKKPASKKWPIQIPTKDDIAADPIIQQPGSWRSASCLIQSGS